MGHSRVQIDVQSVYTGVYVKIAVVVFVLLHKSGALCRAQTACHPNTHMPSPIPTHHAEKSPSVVLSASIDNTVINVMGCSSMRHWNTVGGFAQPM